MKRPLFGLFAALTALAMCPAASADATPTPRTAPPAEAPKDAVCPVSGELIVLHATNDSSGIDPNIGKMPELGKPPFSSYNSYKLLDRSKLCLAKAKSATTKLPNDRDLMVTLKDILEPTKKGDSKRYVVSASIQKPGGSTFLPLLEVNAKPGETFFVAGQAYKGGMLVIGIKIAP